jgi:hypothetical protein
MSNMECSSSTIVLSFHIFSLTYELELSSNTIYLAYIYDGCLAHRTLGSHVIH